MSTPITPNITTTDDRILNTTTVPAIGDPVIYDYVDGESYPGSGVSSGYAVKQPISQDYFYVEQQIRLSLGTKPVCTRCGREDSPVLYLKRSHGFYEMLCRMSDGSGCWPNSPRSLCRHLDQDFVQCTQLAEYKVTFGVDQVSETESCTDHLGRMVASVPSTVHHVYPLED